MAETLKVLCQKIIISKRSKEANFNFIKMLLSQNEISDYKEIITRQLRNTERSTKPKTQIRYRLFIKNIRQIPRFLIFALDA